jgi:DNA replication protein DnaC
MRMDKDFGKTLKYLRLGGILEHWDEYLKVLRKKNFSPVRFLQHVLEEEVKIKSENSRQLRLRKAKIPELWVMETFPFHRQPKLNKKKTLSLYDTLEYVEKRQNVIWIGPTGCGKTGLATSFLVETINAGYTGRYVLFPDLVAELYQSVADHSEERVIKRFLSYDCLLIDELGYVEIEPVQVGLFFTLMHKRHKKASTLITSNLGFKQWQTFLKNAHLTAALIDRLTEQSYVFNMKDCTTLRDKLK